jgi:hypothetical protein
MLDTADQLSRLHLRLGVELHDERMGWGEEGSPAVVSLHSVASLAMASAAHSFLRVPTENV